MNAPAIEAHHLIVRAGKRHLLDVDHLRVVQGSVVALMGPNGAGKTTFLRTCLGLVSPNSGELRVLGQQVSALRSLGLAQLRRRIGLVPQLLPGRAEVPLTVREVVAIGRTAHSGLFHRLSRQDWKITDEWLERLGLRSLANRPFGQISGGEQRKAVIARAMVQEPELLLLDEPTANLDLGWREQIVGLIENLHQQTGVSIVLVCHELEVLPASCRTVILLQAGCVSALGPAESVFTTERVRSLYGPNLSVVHHNGRHAVVPGGEP